MKRDILENLLQWEHKSGRKPLILNGARQVGKTYILREFGENYFKKMVFSVLTVTIRLQMSSKEEAL